MRYPANIESSQGPNPWELCVVSSFDGIRPIAALKGCSLISRGDRHLSMPLVRVTSPLGMRITGQCRARGIAPRSQHGSLGILKRYAANRLSAWQGERPAFDKYTERADCPSTWDGARRHALGTGQRYYIPNSA